MRIPQLNANQKFSSRLTFGVILTTAIIFLIIIMVIIFFVRQGILVEAEKRAEGEMQNTALRINSVLNSVEVAIQNNIYHIKNNVHNPQKMVDITHRIVEQNPTIFGSAIAFEPNYYKEIGYYYAPYSYRDTDSTGMDVLSTQLGTEEYEYHYMDWYQIPKLLKTDYWSEPYYDSGGGEMMMTTYSYPLEDEDGNIYAIVTADVSLDWLTKLITNMRYHEEAYNFVVSRSGTFVVHPDTTKILSETLFTYTAETPDTLDDKIAYDIVAGMEGMVSTDDQGTDSYLFFAPIKRIGWAMGIMCPKNEFFETAYTLGFVILLLMLLGLATLFLVCRTVVKHMTKPLTQFAQSADEIAKGNIETPLPEIKTRDEMMTLRNSFKIMQHSLTTRIEELKIINEQKGRIQGELQVARGIQMAMIPKSFPAFPDRDDIDVFGMLEAAKEVGGDLYDFYIRDEKLFFCIGDVSGKGVPASLLMAVTRSLFRTISAHESLPQRIVTQINEAISDMNETLMFVTLFVGVLDLPSGRLRYCNAGHCAPLLIGSNMKWLPIYSNLPTGVEAGFTFRSQEIIVSPGTIIFLFTDGLTEAENNRSEQFEEKRIIETLRALEKPNEETSQHLVETMRQAIENYVAGAQQSDDLTMMAVKYCKENRAETLRMHLSLPNNIETIPQLNEFVDSVCESVGFDMGTTMSMNLALEEAVVNVMNYAYPQGTQGTVDIEAVANDMRLKFIISDSGTPFDPTTKEEVDINLSADERPIGGLGIHLVRQIMDSVNYERLNDMNVLTLRKKIKE